MKIAKYIIIGVLALSMVAGMVACNTAPSVDKTIETEISDDSKEATDPNVHDSDAEVGRNRNITAQQNDFWATYASDAVYANGTLIMLNATLKATNGNIAEQESAVVRFAERCGYSYDEITNSLTATVKNSEGAIEAITFDLNGLSEITISNFVEMQDAAKEAGVTIPANIALGILTGKISVEEANRELFGFIN